MAAGVTPIFTGAYITYTQFDVFVVQVKIARLELDGRAAQKPLVPKAVVAIPNEEAGFANVIIPNERYAEGVMRARLAHQGKASEKDNSSSMPSLNKRSPNRTRPVEWKNL
jgi:hypothetical protein